MKSLGLVILLLLVLTPLVKGQDKCDCTIVPFKPAPPCFDYCSSKLLATATKEELVLIVGLQWNTAGKIVKWKARNSADSLEDYKKILSEAELKKLREKIESLNNSQAAYFKYPASQRKKVRRSMTAIMN